MTMVMPTKKDLRPYVSHVLDDAGNADPKPIADNARLVVYQCGFEPMVVAVQSYLGVRLNAAEAEDIAMEYLQEIGWFSAGPSDADYII